jgi:hypothetical protein
VPAQVDDQRVAGLLDQIEHPLETGRPALVRIWYFDGREPP